MQSETTKKEVGDLNLKTKSDQFYNVNEKDIYFLTQNICYQYEL